MVSRLFVCLSFMLGISEAFANWALLAEKTVKRAPITLQALFDRPLPNELASLVIAKPPRADSQLIIQRSFIQEIFNSRGYQGQIEGSENITLSLETQLISDLEIRDFTLSSIRNHHHLELGHIIYSIVWDQQIIVPTGEVSMRVKHVQPNRLSKLQHVWVSIEIDNQYYQTVKVPVEAINYQVLPFTRRPIAKSEEITENNIKYKRVNALDFAWPFASLMSVSWRSKKYHRENEPLFQKYIEQIPDIKSGEYFTAVYQSGNLRIERDMAALSDGFLNQKMSAGLVTNNFSDPIDVFVKHDGTGRIIGVIK